MRYARISKLGKIVNKEKRTIQYHRGRGHSPEITFLTKSDAASICGQTIAYVHVCVSGRETINLRPSHWRFLTKRPRIFVFAYLRQKSKSLYQNIAKIFPLSRSKKSACLPLGSEPIPLKCACASILRGNISRQKHSFWDGRACVEATCPTLAQR